MVPAARTERDAIREAAAALARGVDRSRPLDERALAAAGRAVLARVGLDERYLAFAMIMVNNAFWLDQFTAAPFSRRMLLLPRCLRHIRGDGGKSVDSMPGGLSRSSDTRSLPSPDFPEAPDIVHIMNRARQLGYHTLVADGTPIVVQTLAQEGTDAMLGIACLDSLESAFEKVRLLGVPAVAMPLLNRNCADTMADLDLAADLVEASSDPTTAARTRSFLPLWRTACGLFEEAALADLVGEVRAHGIPGGTALRKATAPETAAPASGGEPLRGVLRTAYVARPREHRNPLAGRGATPVGEPLRGVPETGDGAVGRLLADAPALALDWLRRGGKRLRPFVTLAGYRALRPEGDLPESVRRAAVAVEAFHKASLVHDDIEDDDATRYGLPTLHRQMGVDAAINVGDYLLGLGYRLIASTHSPDQPGVAGALLRAFSDAHVSLARGQGAELAWRRAPRQVLSLPDVLRLYALKTAPAFEAALASGMLLAGPIDPYRDLIRRFSRYVGVAFQVLNDIHDWEADLRHRRPTVLPVLAHGMPGHVAHPPSDVEAAPAAGGWATSEPTPGGPTDDEVERTRRRFEDQGVFETAGELVERFRARAIALASEPAVPPGLSDLLLFLTGTILRHARGPVGAGCQLADDWDTR